MEKQYSELLTYKEGFDAAQQEAKRTENLQMQLAHDRDRFESGKIFGIPMMVVLAMIGFLAFVS